MIRLTLPRFATTACAAVLALGVLAPVSAAAQTRWRWAQPRN